MPRFIGQRLTSAVRIEEWETAGLVKLTFRQARILSGGKVFCTLNTSDKGGPQHMAKRWFNWWADADTICDCPASTPRMLELALAEIVNRLPLC